MNVKNGIFKQIFIYRTFGIIDISTKREIWEQVSIKFKGSFSIAYDSSKSLHKFKIKIPYKDSYILITEGETKPLKFEFEFITENKYYLEVLKSDFLSRYISKFSKNCININKYFAENYTIKSNDIEKTKEILTLDILESIQKHKIYSVFISTHEKKKSGNLHAVINRTISSKEELSSLIEFHFKIIDSIV